MKRGWKIFWIIVASLAGLGVVFSCIALGMGLTFGQIREAYPNGIGYVGNEHRGWYYDVEPKEEHEHDGKTPSSAAEEFENITRLEMSVGCCEVKILPSSDDKVRVDASGIHFRDPDSRLEVGRGDETLSVKMMKNGKQMKAFNEMTGSDSLKYGTLYLYLPADLELDEADLKFGAVDVEMDLLKAKDLTLEIGAADCVIKNLDVENIDISVGAGELELVGKVRGDARISCGVGEVEMELEGTDRDFNYKIKDGIGVVSIGENVELSGLGGTKKIDNNSSRKMEIDCGVGNVEISFY